MGDLHDKAARLGEIQGLEEADGIIVTGDLTVTGGAAQARNVLEKLTRYNPVIYAQIGNMDRAEVTDWLTRQGWNTHLCVRELAPGVAIMGLAAPRSRRSARRANFPSPALRTGSNTCGGGPDVPPCGAFRAYASA